MDKAWMDRVLGDCAAFARANAMPDLEAACRRAARVAEAEMFAKEGPGRADRDMDHAAPTDPAATPRRHSDA